MKDIAKMLKPEDFTGQPSDVRVLHEKDFTRTCALIQENYNDVSVKKLSLYLFISYLEAIKEKYKRKSMANNAFTENGSDK